MKNSIVLLALCASIAGCQTQLVFDCYVGCEECKNLQMHCQRDTDIDPTPEFIDGVFGNGGGSDAGAATLPEVIDDSE